jgi:hypothetical protein
MLSSAMPSQNKIAIDPMVSSTPASISSDDLQHLKGAANIRPNYPGAFGVFQF